MRRSELFEAVMVITLVILASLLIIGVMAGHDGHWTLSGVITAPVFRFPVDQANYGNMFTGESGLLYTVDGHDIHAIDSSGRLLWSYAIPDQYNATIQHRTYSLIALSAGVQWNAINASSERGNLYILLTPAHTNLVNGVLLALGPDGTQLWSIAFTNYFPDPGDNRDGVGYPKDLFIFGRCHSGDIRSHRQERGRSSLLHLRDSGPARWYQLLRGTSIAVQ